jgi:hypothetical protein
VTGTGGNLPDLAQAGFAMTTTPSMEVDYAVHHVADLQGYLLSLLRDDPAAATPVRRRFVETLSASANGLAVVVGTAAGSTGPGARSSDDGVRFPDARQRYKNVFSGLARPNPAFLYETLETFEALVAMERSEPSTMTVARALETRDLLHRITSLAADGFGAPLLSVQCPVQVPARVPGAASVRDRGEGVPPPATSHGVRFSIPLARPDARTRTALATEMARYCAERGYGFWVADSRAGHRAGNWFQVLGLERGTERDAGPADPVRTCLPVTFVGPARIGSSHAIVDHLSTFPDVGIAACTISSLDDLAFVHLQLVPGRWAGEQAADLTATLDATAAAPTPAGSGLDHILTALGMRRDADRHGAITASGRDYQALVGSAFRVAPPSPRRRMAIWFSWQAVAGEDALAGPLEALYEAARTIGLGAVGGVGARRKPQEELPNVEYLICRRTGSAVRGKGKISLPKDVVDKRFASPGAEVPASRLCSRWESAWKAELGRRPALGCSESTVAWREWWLGHWTSSL